MLHLHSNPTIWRLAQEKSCSILLAYNTADDDEPDDPSPARGAKADSGGVDGDDWGVEGRGGELGDGAEELAGRTRLGIWWGTWGRESEVIGCAACAA